MASSIAEQKAALRAHARKQLAAMSPDELDASDRALFARFLSLPQVEQADTIFAFWGTMKGEPSTEFLIHELLARGKRVGLPRMLHGRQMEVRQFCPDVPMVPAAFGIPEPSVGCPLIPKKDIDLVLVPALCYDRLGYRLGFGGGYYDRWLEDYSGLRIGLCRTALLCDRVPTEPHDTRVDLLITEDSLSVLSSEKNGA